jgi:hypothetical protein
MSDVYMIGLRYIWLHIISFVGIKTKPNETPIDSYKRSETRLERRIYRYNYKVIEQ